MAGNNYSAEDKKAFRLKDILNSRMSAIKAATIVNEGSGKPVEDVVKEADVYFAWLMQEQPPLDGEAPKPTAKPKAAPKKKVTQSVLPPAPQLEEKKVLDAVAEKLGVPEDNELRVRVREWVFKQVGKEAYPRRMDSVSKIVADLEKTNETNS